MSIFQELFKTKIKFEGTVCIFSWSQRVKQ